jgi:hypothetical protein
MDYTSNNQFSTSSSFTELDFEFDQHLASMKKYVLELTDKKSRQLCALWIQKLCESTGPSYLARKTRNAYSLKLLQLLENYEPLQEPFNDKPPYGQLKPLSSSHNTNTPDWVDRVDPQNEISYRNRKYLDKSPKRYQSPVPPPSTTPTASKTSQVSSYETRFQRDMPKKTVSYHTIDDYASVQDEYDAVSENNHKYDARSYTKTPINDDIRLNLNESNTNITYMNSIPSTTSNNLFSNHRQTNVNELHEEDRKSRQLQNDVC